ncbi:hypothetical protein [Viscerimonas tarda]
MNLQEAVCKFVDVMGDDSSMKDEINSSLRSIYELIPDSSDLDFGHALKSIFSLVKLPNPDRASMAAGICGYLVELGYPGEAIVDDFIEFYSHLIEVSQPFYTRYFDEIEGIDESDEERDEKLNEAYQTVWEERMDINPAEIEAIDALDKFFPCGISLFSAGRKAFFMGKSQLAEKVAQLSEYNQGCYWFNTLFKVLFDEKIVVIDLDTKKGFTASMSGVVDNFQLQLLLMGMPELNDKIAISADFLSVINGSGPQSSGQAIVGKWNMYTSSLLQKHGWKELIGNKKLVVDKAKDYSDSWIWGEGIPADIPVVNGYRVILLGLPSYQRSIQIQRTFKNLAAEVAIEKILSDEEIAAWIN